MTSRSTDTIPPFRGDTGSDLVPEKIGNLVPRHRSFVMCF